MTFFFDARAVAAKIQNQRDTPAKAANPAKQDAETRPHLATLADLAAPTGEIAENRVAQVEPPELPHPVQRQPPERGPVPDKVGVGGRPVTWTGKVVSLDDWRNLTGWERHGPNGRLWNGKTQQWEQAK
ncbi:hypothetical protein I5192_03230 [Ruegeria sp. SCSIO 43209]|uniref:hypothetical protein n=1 Tax=Ruegeria sp. SCSIO 43209 TaxID=2793010 RepID=UPI001CA95F09|nr:hypothetical protein [Ruegeria sp. SCSIO 43209]UAB89710.1 hypothetical protein I5192_03230 [Ruegeria sp. SCSIO 43209]